MSHAGLYRLVGLCGITGLSLSGCVTPAALTRDLNHTSPPVSEVDRAACVEAVSTRHARVVLPGRVMPRAWTIQSGYVACLIAKQYAIRIKVSTAVGILPVVLRAPAGAAPAQVMEDFTACDHTAYLKGLNDHKALSLFTGLWAAYFTAPDDVIAVYLDCWHARGYEAREHHEGEN